MICTIRFMHGTFNSITMNEAVNKEKLDKKSISSTFLYFKFNIESIKALYKKKSIFFFVT